ncbi:hypothetical protein EYC80_009980 [Monilinia laxa]|uniref:Uncharacterized protein n=1 Tax=Monilinia laxa TaxID=61186 RepID=A0A5N6JU59_MONLA|nr:hypothetical protein EYC80_009980 [Monilinia laxa]
MIVRLFYIGYGDGKGNPLAENPQDQGASNAKKHNIEHPGPEPVSEGQGTGAGPTKGGSGSKGNWIQPNRWFNQGERSITESLRRDMTEPHKEAEEENGRRRNS